MGISLEKFCNRIEEIIEKKEYVENSSRFLKNFMERI